MSIPSAYIDSLCEIKSMENKLISTGIIIEIENDSIKVADKNGNSDLISFNTPVKINVFNNKLGFRVLVGNVLTSTEKELKITDIISLVEHERRQFFRVDMQINTIAYIADTIEEAQKNNPVNVIVNDLSLSGARIETRTEFQPNDTLWIKFEIKNKVYFWQCKVIRMVEYDDNGTFNYGCKFKFQNSGENDLLCSYIFQKQREQLKQKSVYVD